MAIVNFAILVIRQNRNFPFSAPPPHFMHLVGAYKVDTLATDVMIKIEGITVVGD